MKRKLSRTYTSSQIGFGAPELVKTLQVRMETIVMVFGM